MLALLIVFSSAPDTKTGEEVELSDTLSPRVRQRKISSSSDAGTPYETTTPKTPKSGRVEEDTKFFGSSFNLDALAEAALLQRPGGTPAAAAVAAAAWAGAYISSLLRRLTH